MICFVFQVLSFTSAQQASSQAYPSAAGETSTKGDAKSPHVQTDTLQQTLDPNGLLPSLYRLIILVEIYFDPTVWLILGSGKTAHYQQGDAKDTTEAVALGTKMWQSTETVFEIWLTCSLIIGGTSK